MIARTCDDEASDSAVLVGEPEVAIRSDGLVVAQFDVEEPDSNQVSFRRNLVRYADESLAILVEHRMWVKWRGLGADGASLVSIQVRAQAATISTATTVRRDHQRFTDACQPFSASLRARASSTSLP